MTKLSMTIRTEVIRSRIKLSGQHSEWYALMDVFSSLLAKTTAPFPHAESRLEFRSKSGEVIDKFLLAQKVNLIC